MAQEDHVDKKIGIAHTRWATCGEISNKNAHPHVDNKNRIALVHNGTIFNFEVLKKDLLERGYEFKTDTDTEIIAVMIGYYLDQG